MENKKKNEKVNPGCFVLLVLAIVGIVWWLNTPTEEKISEGATLKQAAIIAQDFVKENFASDCDFDDLDVRGEETSVKNRFKVLQKFTSSKLGYEQEFVYKIYIQYYGGDWADKKNWDYGQLIVENTSTREQNVYFGSMKDKDAQAETKNDAIEAGGAIFFVVDKTDDVVRLCNPAKLDKVQLKDAINELKGQYKTIYFTTAKDRDHDYVSFINGVVEDNGDVIAFENW